MTLVRRCFVLSALVGLVAGGFAFSVFPAVASASPAWTLRPGCALDIAAGADGSVWVLGCDRVLGGFGIYRWNGSAWVRQPGGAISIGVDPSGNAWVTNEFGQIHRWNGSGWELLPGCANEIDGGPNGSAWVIGCDPVAGGFGIYSWSSTGWVEQAGGAETIAVDASGNHPWVTNDAGQIFSS
jgi:hypothetical protein